MAMTKARVRRWGSSLGIVIPNPAAKELKLKPGDEVLVDVRPTGDVFEAFGSLRDWKVNPRKVKEEARRGW
jgi:bifunctional DNA-binding transcriptional regulator/antitoxin component of YhaV-PrlF toxin-antitoxin module